MQQSRKLWPVTRRKSIKTDPEMIQSGKLVDENAKTIFYTFKKEEESKSMPKRDTYNM